MDSKHTENIWQHLAPDGMWQEWRWKTECDFQAPAWEIGRYPRSPWECECKNTWWIWNSLKENERGILWIEEIHVPAPMAGIRTKSVFKRKDCELQLPSEAFYNFLYKMESIWGCNDSVVVKVERRRQNQPLHPLFILSGGLWERLEGELLSQLPPETKTCHNPLSAREMWGPRHSGWLNLKLYLLKPRLWNWQGCAFRLLVSWLGHILF